MVSGQVMSKSKTDFLSVTGLVVVALLCFGAGLKWGLPSKQRNMLYFSGPGELLTLRQQLRNYQVEQAWKGMGSYLVLHPEEAERKLPRSLYNPIRSYHPDEYFVLKSLATMKPSRFDFHPHQFGVGGVYLYSVGAIIFLLSRVNLVRVSQDLDFAFTNPDDFANLYLCGRGLTVFYAVATILLFYFLARRLLKNSASATVAGLMLTFTPLMILNTHYMYVDIPALFWVTATIYFTFLFLETRLLRWLVLAGVSAGLSSGCKFSLLVTLVIPLAGVFCSRFPLRKILPNLLLVLGAFTASFILTNPYFILTFPEPLIDLGQHTGRSFEGRFYLQALVAGLGWPLCAFLTIGFSGSFLILLSKGTKERKYLTLLFFWTVFFFLFLSCFSKNFARYLLPLVPSLVLIGIRGWEMLLLNRKGIPGKKIFSAILSLVAASTIFFGLAYLSLFLKENVRFRAGVWMKQNLPSGCELGVTEVPWQFQMPDFNPQHFHLILCGYDSKKLQRLKPEYFILSSFQAPVAPFPLKLNKEKVIFWEEFNASGWYQPLKVFQVKASFLGLDFQPEKLPEDLIYLNPTIVIFQRVRP